MKRLLWIEGHGFSSCPEMGITEAHVEKLHLSLLEEKNVTFPDFGDYDLVVVAGAWAMHPSEWMLQDCLMQAFSSFFSKILEAAKAKKTNVLFVGRGSLMALDYLSDGDWRTSMWTTLAQNHLTWSDLEINWEKELEDKESSLLPALRYSDQIPMINFEQLDGFKSWLRFQDEFVGWQGKGVFLSLLNIMAYHDKAQRPEFGYQATKGLFSAPMLIKKLMGIQDSE